MTTDKPAARPAATPETDEQAYVAVSVIGEPDEYVVSADFARKLERESTALRTELDDLKQRLLPQFAGRAERAERQLAAEKFAHAASDRTVDETIDECEGLKLELADVRKDSDRLAWVLSILTAQGEEGDKRALRLARQFIAGLDGIAALDEAQRDAGRPTGASIRCPRCGEKQEVVFKYAAIDAARAGSKP